MDEFFEIRGTTIVRELDRVLAGADGQHITYEEFVGTDSSWLTNGM